MPQNAPGHAIGTWEVSECTSARVKHGPTHGLELNPKSLGRTDVTPAATGASPCWGSSVTLPFLFSLGFSSFVCILLPFVTPS